MKHHYPIILDLTDRPCLVVGGGDVAARKIQSLVETGAQVTVIAPDAVSAVAAWADEGVIEWRRELFAGQDVGPYTLVVAATDQPEVNLAVWRAVTDHGGWINIVDRPDLCNFIVPSTFRRGQLVIAVSTSGASPGLARRIKQHIEREIGPEYEGYVDFLAAMRQRVHAEVNDPAKRREIFRRLLDESFLAASDEERREMAEDLLRGTL